MKLKSSNNKSFVFLGALVVLTALLLSLNNTSTKKKDEFVSAPDFEQKTPLNLIQLTFSEKQYKKLKKKRDHAISIGVLETDDSDYVPATLTFNGEPFNAEVRLKGDWTDHLLGDKWSFRVKLNDDRTILGMRKFSLHHPSTRGYLNEWLYHKAIKNEELIGLRYSFLEGSIHIKLKNSSQYVNKAVGVYAIEETFDKRTIENNKRKESVILKFSEEYWWNEVKKSIAVGASSGIGYSKFMNRSDYPVRAFSESKILEDSTMRNYFKIGKELLKDSREGKISVSEAFDIKKLARQNALLNLFGGTHGNLIINVRFYYNPITSKLEPIAFDSNSGQKLRQFEEFNFLKGSKIIETEYYKELAYALNEVSHPEYLDKLINANKTEMSNFEKVLKSEFNVNGVALNNLKHNQNIMRDELAKLQQKYEFETIKVEAKKAETISMPVFSSWAHKEIIPEKAEFNYKNEEAYSVSRKSNTKSSFSIINNIDVNYGQKYRASIIAKKGNDTFLGMRIQGLYPDRVDAIFDLAKGKVKGVKKAGGFENENASIRSLGNDWYECTISGKINASDLRIILGPTNNDMNVLSWEATTKNICSVNIVPSSLIINQID